MKDKLRPQETLNVAHKLVNEISHHIQNTQYSAPGQASDAMKLIAADVLVEMLQRETGQDGRSVVQLLNDKIHRENYEDDVQAAIDMALELLGNNLYEMIPDEVATYFADRQ